tara:strand:+ start:382 stop:576 length:195 start_codon:yes stop_codon:yes gene_type:complete
MNELIILQKIEDAKAMRGKVADAYLLEVEIKMWERHLADIRRHNLEERVGFKSMERNAGVWDER